MTESHDFLLNAKNLRTTTYTSLAIAHLVLGSLHPEAMVVAACGFAFFAALALSNLRPDQPEKNGSNKKLAHLNK